MTLASTSRGIGVSIPCDAFPSDAEQLRVCRTAGRRLLHTATPAAESGSTARRLWGPVLTVIVLSYGIHITVVSYVLYVLRQIVIAEPSPMGWISLRLLTWSAAVLSGTA